MEAIKIRKRINSSSLTISDLDKFKGKDVEIIIITDQETFDRNNLARKRTKTKSVAGILERYKDPLKKAEEVITWDLVVKWKYANN
jgi:hypothetical protein